MGEGGGGGREREREAGSGRAGRQAGRQAAVAPAPYMMDGGREG